MAKSFRDKISKIADKALNGAKKIATHKTKITRDLIMNPPIGVGSLNNVAKKGASSFSQMNKERIRQGLKPIKDRASKGLYDFLDKYR